MGRPWDKRVVRFRPEMPRLALASCSWASRDCIYGFVWSRVADRFGAIAVGAFAVVGNGERRPYYAPFCVASGH